MPSKYEAIAKRFGTVPKKDYAAIAAQIQAESATPEPTLWEMVKQQAIDSSPAVLVKRENLPITAGALAGALTGGAGWIPATAAGFAAGAGGEGFGQLMDTAGITAPHGAPLPDALKSMGWQGLLSAGPEVLTRTLGPIAKALFRPNANATEAEAMKWLMDQGVDVNAAAVSGNPVVKGVQHLADRTIGGAMSGAAQASQREAESLAQVGMRQAERAAPKAGAQTIETGGTGIRTAKEKLVGGLEGQSRKAYRAADVMEQDPANAITTTLGEKVTPTGVLDAGGKMMTRTAPVTETLRVPIDMVPIKKELAPVMEVWNRTWSDTKRAGSPAYTALKSILEGPDQEAFMVAEENLKTLKTAARVGKGQSMDRSQYLASKGVGMLQRAVDEGTAKVAGLKPVMEEARGSWAASRRVKEALDPIAGEGIGGVDTAMKVLKPRDAGIEDLQAVYKHTPDAIPALARGWLEDKLARSTATGGFDKTASLWNEWQSLGPKTKAILFGHEPGLVKDLDKFFLAAKRVQESGSVGSPTAYLTSLKEQALGLGTQVATAPLVGPLNFAGIQLSGAAISKLMHSRAGVKLLTEGLSEGWKQAGSAVRRSGQAGAVAALNKMAAQEKQQEQPQP